VIAEFAKLIGDGVEALAVRVDGCVALGSVAKLIVEAGDTGVNVVLQELPKG
jgi:hypothetical protein